MQLKTKNTIKRNKTDNVTILQQKGALVTATTLQNDTKRRH